MDENDSRRLRWIGAAWRLVRPFALLDAINGDVPPGSRGYNIRMSKIRMLQIEHYLDAARKGRREDLEASLEAFGPGVEIVDEKGCSALAIAAGYGYLGCAQLLVSKGADIESRDDLSCTPLMAVCGGGSFEHRVGSSNIELARLLLEAGARMDAKGPRGASALMMASRRADSAMVAELISRGASLDAIDESGLTALMHAAKAGNPDCAGLLMEAGCDAEVRDSAGATALDIARLGADRAYSSSPRYKECARRIEVQMEKRVLSSQVEPARGGQKVKTI